MTNNKQYFDNEWTSLEMSLVPLEFTITSKKILKRFLELLNKSHNILEFACSIGGNSVIFHRYNPDILYTGVDISSVAIAKAQKANSSKKSVFYTQDLEKPYKAIDLQNIIFCSQLIEHIEDNKEFLKNIYQNLTPNGHIFLSTVYKKKNSFYFYKNKRGDTVLAPDHIHEYTDRKTLRNKLKESGFKILDEDIVLFRYPLIDIPLKFFMRYLKDNHIYQLVNSRPIMLLRQFTSIPIFGFYNFQIIAKKLSPSSDQQ